MSLMLLCAGVAMVVAQDTKAPAEAAMEMPPMGPTDEIKAMGHLVGTWETTGKMRMDPTSEWIDYSGTSEYQWIAGGSALMSTFTSTMFGMPFIGHSVETYDRETKQYQTMWVDNMGARQSLYLGTMVDGKLVFMGEDTMGGMTFKTRTTISNMKETSYDFMMEHSMDGGKTWFVGMDGKYTKKM